MIEIKYGVPVHCVAYLAQLHCRRIKGVTFLVQKVLGVSFESENKKGIRVIKLAVA